MEKANMEMIKEFESFIPYVEDLTKIDHTYWNQPIAEGKWTLKDNISHIMLWDKYFYENAIEKIKLGQPVTVRHLNFDEFNANAIEYAKTQSHEEIIQQCKEFRFKIIQAISGLPEEEYTRAYKDGDGKKFSIRGYLEGFIPHDTHHKKQIDRFIKVKLIET